MPNASNIEDKQDKAEIYAILDKMTESEINSLLPIAKLCGIIRKII